MSARRVQCVVKREEDPRAVAWYFGDWEVALYGPEHPHWPSFVCIRNAHNRTFAQVWKPAADAARRQLAGCWQRATPDDAFRVLEPIGGGEMAFATPAEAGVEPVYLITGEVALGELVFVMQALAEATRAPGG